MSYVYMSKNKFVVEGLKRYWDQELRIDGSVRPSESWVPVMWFEKEEAARRAMNDIAHKYEQVRVRRIDDRTENTQAHQPY